MEKYENYLLSFPNFSYIEKSRYGKPTQRFSKDGFQLYEPFSYWEFERKMDLNTSFNIRWGNKN